MILLRGRNLQQPRGLVGVDWANPITRGLLAAAGHPHDSNVVTGRPWGRGISTRVVTDTRIGWITKAGGVVYTTPVAGMPIGNAPRTLIAWIRRPVSSTAETWAGYGTVLSNQQWTLGYFGGNVGLLCFANDLVATPFSGADVHMLAATHDGTTARLYVDGVQVNFAAKTFATTAGNGLFGMGGSGSQAGGSGSAVADSGAVSLYNRALSAAEIRSLYQTPWQILRAPARRIWIPSSAVAPNVAVPVPLKQRWRQQPRVQTGIDWSNPLTKDLITAGHAGGGVVFDGVNGVALTPLAGASIGRRNAGSMAVSNIAGDSWNANITPSPISSGDAGSLFVLAESTLSNLSRKRAIRLWNSTAGTVMSMDFANNTVNRVEAAAQTGVATFSLAQDGSAPAANVPIHALYTRAGTTQVLYREGIDQTTTTTGASAGNFAADIDRITIGATTNSLSSLRGGVFVWAAWRRALTAAEAKSLYENPWQLFKPQARRAWFSAAVTTPSPSTGAASSLQRPDAATALVSLLIAGAAAASTFRSLTAAAGGVLTAAAAAAAELVDRPAAAATVAVAAAGAAAQARSFTATLTAVALAAAAAAAQTKDIAAASGVIGTVSTGAAAATQTRDRGVSVAALLAAAQGVAGARPAATVSQAAVLVAMVAAAQQARAAAQGVLASSVSAAAAGFALRDVAAAVAANGGTPPPLNFYPTRIHRVVAELRELRVAADDRTYTFE